MGKKSGNHVKAHRKKTRDAKSRAKADPTRLIYATQVHPRTNPKPDVRESSDDADENITGADPRALARLAENIWRLERRAGQATDSTWALPVIERLHDDLRDLQVEIIDRTNTPYRDGETMEKLHSDAPEGWAGGLIVTEVITPTVRIGGVVVELGKVVVGPVESTANKEGEACQGK